jgi:general secretion pathway protein J
MRSRADAGFSLVELLVSVALLGLLSLLMLNGVFSGRRVWERLENRTAAVESVEAAQTTLRARLQRSFPLARYDASAPYVDFEGEADTLSFLAPPALAARPAALRRFTLGVSGTGDLVLVSASDLALDAREASAEEVLLSGVQSVDIAYWGAAPPDGGVRWRSRWVSQPTPPELVRIRVVLAPGDRRFWPELLVRPAADLASNCVLDPVTGLCGSAG